MHLSSVFLALLGVSIGASAASPDDCPGYTATNIVQSATGLTADLSLAGTACNAYGYDLGALKLLVEYQTGMHLSINNVHSVCSRLTQLQIPDFM